MPELAINGGPKIRETPFPSYDVLDQKEIDAVEGVLRTGILSRFLGAWHEDFYGGPKVQEAEKAWSKFFKVEHVVSMNSATSCLIAALGALGISKGDEVIVSPYSMSISATAPLFYGAIPVFADVEPDYFCLDPASVEACITKKTKAIIVVDLFGQPYNAKEINRIANRYKIPVIEDASQAPGAMFRDRYAGTLGTIGVFSLNYHKHIHSGEGGMAVTDDPRLAERLRLIRNHAEAVVEKKGETDLVNMLGFNMRMTEIEAAIAREQIKKLPVLIRKRIRNVHYIAKKLASIPYIRWAPTRSGATHAYYVHAFLFDEAAAGVSRDRFLEAVKAELAVTKRREGEGVKINAGYTRPLYMLPLFQKRASVMGHRSSRGYPKGLCPVVEGLHYEKLGFHELMHPNMERKDLDDVVGAFKKVAKHLDELM